MINMSNHKLLAEERPDLVEEWDYEKNGDLLPMQVAFYSKKKVWWKCKEGHSWEASISNRTGKMHSNCPYCSGHKVLEGYNDLASVNPKLAGTWDYEKNGKLLPSMVTPGSNKKVWWKCKKGHEWQAIVSSRTNGIGCPVCSGKKVLEGYNDLKTLRPEIANEWNYERNGNLLPTQVTCGSSKKVWWKCSKGHEWESTICGRTSNGIGCPICVNQKVLSGYNDLATLNPELANEWDYEKNRDLLPSQVTCGTDRKVWWKCKVCGHEWQAGIGNRNRLKQGCPECAKRNRWITRRNNRKKQERL